MALKIEKQGPPPPVDQPYWLYGLPPWGRKARRDERTVAVLRMWVRWHLGADGLASADRYVAENVARE